MGGKKDGGGQAGSSSRKSGTQGKDWWEGN